jgi:hypothetical protein
MCRHRHHVGYVLRYGGGDAQYQSLRGILSQKTASTKEQESVRILLTHIDTEIYSREVSLVLSRGVAGASLSGSRP